MRHHPAVERALADAAALVRVASPEDWPNGFVVTAERLPGMRGLAIGAGQGLAAACGLRGGVATVLVDPARVFATPAAPTRVELADLDALVCHEAAHALVGTDASGERVAELLTAAPADVAGYTATTVAEHHNPAWAAAFWLLVDRGAAFRRDRGQLVREYARHNLAAYGFPPDDVHRVTRGADLAVALRRLLARNTPAAAVMDLALPDIETRAAAIVAAGIVREPQPTGVVS
jgi:hypothetical protein